MENELLEADSRELFEPMVSKLEEIGARRTFEWLVDLLGQQRPSLRSPNSHLIAYTGCVEAIDWLESNVATPVTTHWGVAAALLGTPWSRIETWLKSERPKQIMALDALYAYRLPAPNMAPLEQIAAPVLVNPPKLQEFEATLKRILKKGANPRMRQTIESILARVSEILEPRNRRVSVSDLPRLFIDPESFPDASKITQQHEAVMTEVRSSLQEIVKDGQS